MSKESFHDSFYLVNHKTYERLIVETGIEGAKPYIEAGFTAVNARQFDDLYYYAALRVDYLAKLHKRKEAANKWHRERRITSKIGKTPKGKDITTKPKR